jgi:dual specificity phosphatase 12
MSGVSTLTAFILVIIFLIASLFLQSSSEAGNNSLVKNINPNINEIATGLYLTDFNNAKDYESLKQLGVRQILTIGKELPRHGEPLFKAMHVRIDDSPSENIKKHFNSTYNFINRGPTVVHCAAGVSRSATIVAAYLIRRFKMSSDKALTHIWECRKVINPNYGFKQQLKQFEKELEANADSTADSTAEETQKGENCEGDVCKV